MKKQVYYNTKDQMAFQKALRQAVDSYFQTTGQSIKGNGLMYAKAAFFFIWMTGAYALLLFSNTRAELFAFYLLFGFGTMFFTISVAHDASHQALFTQKWLNKLFSYSWNLLGLSTYFWELKHHEGHHNVTNIIDYDSDISPSKLIRLHPKAEHLWFHRYQNGYVYLLYALFGPLTMFVREFRLYPIHEFGNATVQHPPFTLLRLFLMKIGYFLFVFGIPALLIPQPAWVVFLAFLAMSMACGIYMIIILAMPHVTTYTHFIEADEQGMLHTNWYTHTLETTLDTSPQNRLLNWFTGGLNTHVVHHIFPHICHIHYYQLSPIIEKVTREYGMIYLKASLWDSIKGHFDLIRELRLPEKKSEHRILRAEARLN